MYWSIAMAIAAEVVDPMRAVMDGWAALQSGDTERALRHFEAALAAEPGAIDAAVGRGHARVAQGRTEDGRDDLLRGLDATIWTRTKRTSVDFTSVDTESTTLDLLAQRRVGIGTLAVYDAEAGRVADAVALLDRADRVFGDSAVLAAARARAELAAGQNARAWGRLVAALGVADPTRYVASVASRMVAADPNGAPPDVYAALERAGQWTASYNRAAGLLRSRQYAPCLDAARAGMERFPGEAELVALAYRCAARADRLAADALLVVRGGARRVPVGDLVAHADRHVQGGAADRALELLAEIAPRETADRLRWADATVRAALAVPDLDRAMASSSSSSPALALQVAHKLVDAQRLSDADRLLKDACPALGDAAEAGACLDLARWVDDRLAKK